MEDKIKAFVNNLKDVLDKKSKMRQGLEFLRNEITKDVKGILRDTGWEIVENQYHENPILNESYYQIIIRKNIDVMDFPELEGCGKSFVQKVFIVLDNDKYEDVLSKIKTFVEAFEKLDVPY